MVRPMTRVRRSVTSDPEDVAEKIRPDGWHEMRSIYRGRNGRVAQRLKDGVSLVCSGGRGNHRRERVMVIADFGSNPLIVYGPLEDRVDVLCERWGRRHLETQAVDRGLQQRVVQTNDVEDRRRETRRRTDHPCATRLNRWLVAVECDRRGHRTIGNVVVPAIVVGKRRERRVGGRTGSAKSAEYQKPAAPVGLNFAQWHRDSHEMTGVKEGGSVGTGDRARTGCDHEGAAISN